jgi:hypothetical protein
VTVGLFGVKAANSTADVVPAVSGAAYDVGEEVIAGEEIDVRFAALSGSRVVINEFGCGKKKSVYRWKVAAGRLTLTKLQGSCGLSNLRRPSRTPQRGPYQAPWSSVFLATADSSQRHRITTR